MTILWRSYACFSCLFAVSFIAVDIEFCWGWALGFGRKAHIVSRAAGGQNARRSLPYMLTSRIMQLN